MLHAGCQNELTGFKHKPVSQQVQRFGRIPPKNDNMGRGIGADKTHYNIACMFIEMSRKAGFIACSTMNAGIPGKKVFDCLSYLDQWWCAGGAIQIDIAYLRSIVQRHFCSRPNDPRAWVGCAFLC